MPTKRESEQKIRTYLPFGLKIDATQMRRYNKELENNLLADILTKVNILLATLSVSRLLSDC
jgi:hypothetical protein